MDSMDLEREKGITILAKNTAVRFGETKINIVDTPGHADFGGEVERGLTMVDGVLLLVDASEGPLPQTRFVLRKALEAQAARDPRRQQGRPAGRADRGGRQRGLRALPRPRRRREPDRVPDRLLQRAGGPGRARPDDARRRPASRCFDAPARDDPGAELRPEHPLQALVTNLDASPYVGRLALCRVQHGTIRKGQQVAWCRADGTDRARQGDRALRDRGARPGRRRRGRPGRDRRGRRPARGDDRRDARRPGRPAPAAGLDRRRAVALDDDRDQHLAARRAARATS